MPKKHRSHDIEDESIDRFKALLPSWLIYREKPKKDYGIDGEVEEFDSDDETTGLVFLTQLKGTDERNLKKALARSLPRGHVTYYRNLTLPVLMVRYVSANDTIYTRWSHSLDTYGKKADWKTTTFRWEEEDAWTDTRAAELVAEAKAFLELRSSRVEFPFTLHADLQPPDSWNVEADEIELALGQQITPRAELLRLGSGEAPPGVGKLTVRPDRLAVEFARVTAVTVHRDKDFEPESASQIAHDLLALTALAFEHFGQLRAAGLLASTYLPGSVLVENEEGVVALRSAMAESRQIAEALALAEALDEDEEDESRSLSLLFMLVALHHSATLSGFEAGMYRDVMKRRVARRGETTDAARETMNLAQFELVQGDPDDAVALYEQVLELDPSYEDRVHFRRARADALFRATEKVESEPRGMPGDPAPPNEAWATVVEAYESLEEISDQPRDEALLADALMFAGHYQAALDVLMVFNQENSDPQPMDQEWVLKEIVLTEIVNELGITSQDRRAVVLEPTPTVTDELVELLNQDALAPMVWWNLAVSRFEVGRLSDAAVPFLAAALITAWDANAWAHAGLGFVEQERVDLFGLVLVTGVRMSAGNMVYAMTQLIKDQAENFPKKEFLAAVRASVEELPPTNDSTELRMLRDNGSVESVTVPGATAPADDPSPATATQIPKVGRNDRCPCGSGHKYKKCHGAS